MTMLTPSHDDETLKTAVEAICWYAQNMKELTNLSLLLHLAGNIYRNEKRQRNERKISMADTCFMTGMILEKQGTKQFVLKSAVNEKTP